MRCWAFRVADIDVAVPMPPSARRLAHLVATHGIKVIATGTGPWHRYRHRRHPCLRDHLPAPRHRNRWPPCQRIAFTDDWAEDAARRDFTINALYASATGEIFDYATGVEDLIAGKVRFMGDARIRIAEDTLRILRLFRFHAWYGKGEIDAEGLRAAADAKGRLKTLSAERVQKELLRLLEAGNPAAVLRVMAATGILSELLPGALSVTRLERLAEIDADNMFPRDAVLRLAALLPDGDDDAADAVADALKLSAMPTAQGWNRR